MNTLYEDIARIPVDHSPAKTLLAGAVVVQVDNVAEYLIKNRRGISDLIADNPIIAPTHPLMWFEYNSLSMEPGAGVYGYLIQRTKNASSAASMTINITEFIRVHVANAADQGIRVGHNIFIPHKYQVHLDEKGMIIRVDKDFKLAELSDKGLRMGTLGQLTVPLYALSLLNCENVSLETPKRTSAGTTLHVLQVRSASSDQVVENRKTSHQTIIRGHQKDFRQGQGLFGRLHGIYWWGC